LKDFKFLDGEIPWIRSDVHRQATGVSQHQTPRLAAQQQTPISSHSGQTLLVKLLRWLSRLSGKQMQLGARAVLPSLANVSSTSVTIVAFAVTAFAPSARPAR
jgi:hypothetical protein